MIPVHVAGAELAFRVTDLAAAGDRINGSMPSGPWLADRHGTPVAGAFGVLVDNVLGLSLADRRPDGMWPVSSEISIDVLRPYAVAAGAGPFRAETDGDPILDGLGGYVAGSVEDASGDVIALCSQRGRWIPHDGSFASVDPSVVDLEAETLERLLGVTPTRVDTGATVQVHVDRLFANALGNLHGGLALCLSDLTASAALSTPGDPWVTESLRIEYLRPLPAGAEVEFAASVRHSGRHRAVATVTGSIGRRLCTIADVSSRPAT